jgi:hypothetical protein
MGKEKAPSGRVYEWRKPPRYVHWKHGRIAQSFFARFGQIAAEQKGMTDEEKAASLFEGMTDEESARLQAYVDDVVGWGLRPEIEDVSTIAEIDYWHFFGKAVYGGGTAINTTEGVTDAETVGNFRPESTLSATSKDVPDIQPVASEPDGNIRSFISG